MKNRAKCKLCDEIIESFHSTDIAICKCGEIEVSEGNSMKCGAKDWNNFIRVDDLGNEIIPKIIHKENTSVSNSKNDYIKMLEELIKSYENLPIDAFNQPITNYDLAAALMIILKIVKD